MTVKSFEQRLRERGILPTPQDPPAVTAPIVHRADAAIHRYLDAALTSETSRLAATTEGSRNHTLNTAAYSLGQLVAGTTLDEETVTGELTRAAYTAGLAEPEVQTTIRSGLEAGKKKPRAIPDPTTTYNPAPIFELVSDDPATQAAAVAAYIEQHLPRIDWHALWADDDTEEWIVEPLLPARRLVALYSAPKVGKSLLMLEIAVAVATGRDILGVTPDRTRKVLYVDFENDPKADIRERLQAMNVGPSDLDNLCYLSYPNLAALDSERGGVELLQTIRVYECEVVVIDTVSRSIAGEENENDTWLSFYRHTGLKLKQAGVALVRLDHSGKDETKGQRGGSAKSGDVDAVWRLSRVIDDTYRLDCEAARMQVVEKTLVIHRETSPHLHHRVDAAGRGAANEAKIQAVLTVLTGSDLPLDAGRVLARALLKERGVKCGDPVLSAALKRRREQGRMTAWEAE